VNDANRRTIVIWYILFFSLCGFMALLGPMALAYLTLSNMLWSKRWIRQENRALINEAEELLKQHAV
jgi:hypothetical protein